MPDQHQLAWNAVGEQNRLQSAHSTSEHRAHSCQRAAKGLSSIAWTRHHTLARDLKATNRLLLPAPATKQEPPTEGTAPDLDTG